MEKAWPSELHGVAVTVIPRRSIATRRYEERLRVPCCNPAHLNCSKSRSIALGPPAFGTQGVLDFLGSWLSKACKMTEHGHAKYTCAPDDVRAYQAASSV